MTEFTKGKWTADDMGEYVFAHSFDMMICQMRGWAYLNAQGLSPDEAIDVQKANARLIAAAPEMYELMKVWVQVQAQPTLRNAQDKAQELLARIDGDNMKGGDLTCQMKKRKFSLIYLNANMRIYNPSLSSIPVMMIFGCLGEFQE